MQFWINGTPLLVSLYSRLLNKIVSQIYVSICVSWSPAALLNTTLFKTLLLDRYIWIHLFEYTGGSFCSASLTYTTDDGKSATITYRSKQILSSEIGQSRQTIEDLFLDCPFTRPGHVDYVYADFSFFKNLTFSLSHKSNIWRSMSAKQDTRDAYGQASTPDFHLGFSIVSYPHGIFCLISTIDITWTFRRSSHAVFTGIVSAYEHLSPNHQIFRDTPATLNRRLYPR